MGYARTKLEEVEAEREELQAKLSDTAKALGREMSDNSILKAKLEAAESLLNKTATEASFGFCAAFVQDGVEMPRTGYGDGWNAAMAKITRILEHQDDEAWVIREAYDRVDKEAIEARKENDQLKKACVEVIEMLEHASPPRPRKGTYEMRLKWVKEKNTLITHLRALRNEHTS